MTSWVLLAVCVASLVVLVQSAGRGWGGPVTLVAAYLGLQLVVRPLLLLTGLDTPNLPDPNATQSTDRLIEGALLIAAVWIVALTVGATLVAGRRPAGTTPRPAAGQAAGAGRPASTTLLAVSDRATRRAILPLAGVAIAGTAVLIARHGGYFQLAGAVKLAKVQVPSIVRFCALWAAVLGAAVATVDAVHRRPGRGLGAATVATGAAIASYAWGARDAMIFPLITVTATWLWLRAPRRLSPRTVRRLLGVIVVVLAVAFGLRLVRDDRTLGSLDRLDSMSLTRRASVSVNATMFDALMVVRSHWPEQADYVGLRYFAPGAPEGATVGRGGEATNFNVLVARVSDPSRNNGTPATAAGDWFAAFGYTGVVFGGILSGMLISLLEWWRRRAGRSSIAFASGVATVLTFSLMSTGVRADSLDRAPAVLSPLLLVVAIHLLSRRPPRQARPEEHALATLGHHRGDHAANQHHHHADDGHTRGPARPGRGDGGEHEGRHAQQRHPGHQALTAALRQDHAPEPGAGLHHDAEGEQGGG
ncbi:MAG: oligosaccharide repeat unit polymerase [Acidimicrobiaceae bacterium]|nr:oligosaccharide repeat unit polymerase [Ilumatobacter sp.]MCB9381423.1 oligosaccharide repeat unit polymerase [Acidimicrobiaceae bacterium]MCO5331333.1 oligosaccharide repeat unit polymerase [Ilumatobacteraceae bacterium]